MTNSQSKKIFILVPALDLTGPIRGAAALANGLIDSHQVTFVILKRTSTKKIILKPQVNIVSLESLKGPWKKYRYYRKMLEKESQVEEIPISISFCFSADLLNFFLRSRARVITSIRAHFSKSYPKRYGMAGHLLAGLHYFILRRFHHVIVLSEAMKKQVQRRHFGRVSVVGNFIDEPQLEMFRLPSPESLKNGRKKVCFLGSFTKRKRADLMIQGARLLKDRNVEFKMTMIGDGPLRNELEKMAALYGLKEYVHFPGFIEDPYSFIQEADLLVLPSESEGVPRAVLEALFFGVPCLLRDVDANAELIQHGVNGYLFKADQELGNSLANALLKDPLKSNRCLIPPQFRREVNIKRILEIIKNELPDGRRSF